MIDFILSNILIIFVHLIAAVTVWLFRVQLGALIWAVYKFIWYTVLQRREPFTNQLARMVVCHGGIFWLVYVGGQFWLYQGIQPPWWLAIDWLLANAMLMDHLIDYARLHPDNLPNR